MSDEPQNWVELAVPVIREELRAWLDVACGRLQAVQTMIPNEADQEEFARALADRLDREVLPARIVELVSYSEHPMGAVFRADLADLWPG